MANQEEDRLKNAGKAVVVMDQQPASENRNKPSGQDGPSDGPHKRPKVPGIPSVAENVKEDLNQTSHVISKPYEENKVPKEIINQQDAKMQSTTSHVPVVKQSETIELTKIGSGQVDTVPVIKKCPTITLTKKMDPNFEKRFVTTFPAEIGSEPTVSEVPRRFEGTVSKKKLEHIASSAVNRSEDKGSEIIESESTKRVKQSQPIPPEVKPPITKASLASKTDDRSDEDEDSLSENIVVLPRREETRISAWTTNDDIDDISQKRVSWDDFEYLNKVQLQILSDTPSTSRASMPYTKPCGIALCLPQRSQSAFNSSSTAKTGIHIEIYKGSLVRSQSQFSVSQMEDIENKKMPETSSDDEQFSTTPHCLTVLREKLDTICDKIINYFNR
ncbi:uncharacterized protein LOC134796378 [Cydia splendana]|uniref:uncharacterized protein LOC134796378 n=1 Tax=Cydia splendana TaxID=1100963 RepID=UPI00300D53DA